MNERDGADSKGVVVAVAVAVNDDDNDHEKVNDHGYVGEAESSPGA